MGNVRRYGGEGNTGKGNRKYGIMEGGKVNTSKKSEEM